MDCTCAKLRTVDVVAACQSVIAAIDSRRQKMKIKAVNRQFAKWRPIRSFFRGPMTMEEAERVAETEHMFGAPWHYRGERQRGVAERILTLALATESQNIYVSSEDFDWFSSYYKRPTP